MADSVTVDDRADEGEGEIKFRHRLEYLLARAAAFALLCTDVRGAARIGRVLARLLGRVDARHRRVAEENFRSAYGASLPEAEVQRLAMAVYDGLGTTAAEVIHGPRRIRGRAARRWFVPEGFEALRATVGEGPVVFLGAHLGNWEHLATALRLNGWNPMPVARPLDNPLLDRWIERTRRAVGNEPVAKGGAMRNLLRSLRSGRSVGMLVDQNGGRHGRLSTFFGRPCSTQAAGVTLARRMKVPFVVVALERQAPGIHRLVAAPPVYVEDDDDAEQRAVDEMNRLLEACVRRRPSDWMWLHRRWRIKADWGFPVEPTERAWKNQGVRKARGRMPRT